MTPETVRPDDPSGAPTTAAQQEPIKIKMPPGPMPASTTTAAPMSPEDEWFWRLRRAFEEANRGK